MRLKATRTFLIVAVAFVSSAVQADPQFDRCEKRSTAHKLDIELGACGAAWVKREEVLLNAAWARVLASFKQDTPADYKQAMMDEQQAWLAFKDKACRQFDLMSAGTLGRFHDANVCRAEVIEDRVSQVTSNLRGKSLS